MARCWYTGRRVITPPPQSWRQTPGGTPLRQRHPRPACRGPHGFQYCCNAVRAFRNLSDPFVNMFLVKTVLVLRLIRPACLILSELVEQDWYESMPIANLLHVQADVAVQMGCRTSALSDASLPVSGVACAQVR